MRKPVTNEQFDAKLFEIIDRNPASALLAIAGVYELVAEEFNNEVLQEIAFETGHDVEREEVEAALADAAEKFLDDFEGKKP